MNEENNEIKRKLWMPIIKNPNNPSEYLGILSDDSLDRDDEGMAKELVESWEQKGLPSLANHENRMEKWLGGWSDLKARQNKGHTALFAAPWFFSKEANPLAQQVKKQVDEAVAKGLNPGISIGFIVHKSEMRKIGGKEKRIFTEGELIEASWVPIQSNRNASFGHVAKNFDIKAYYKNKEEKKMSEFTQKDIDSAVEKSKADFVKDLESKSTEIITLTKSLQDSKKECDKVKNELSDSEKSVKDTKVELEKSKKSALEKQQFIDEQAKGDTGTSEEFDAKTKDGKLPISYA